MVMAVYAPNCKKEFDGHERFKKKSPMSCETDVELGPRNSMSPATSMWSWDNYVQTRTMRSLVRCTNLHAGKDEGNDQSGFKKMMCCGNMREFTCKVTWKRRKKKAQLDYILVPRRKADKAFLHSAVKTCHSWDDYPICAVIQEDDASNHLLVKKRRKKSTGWIPTTMMQKLNSGSQ